MGRTRLDSWMKGGALLFSGARARQGMFAIADQAVNSGTNFLTGVIVARVCAEEQLGFYMLGLSILIFAMGMQDSIITSPYTFFSHRLTGHSHSHYTGSTLIHLIGFSLAVMVALAVGAAAHSLVLGPTELTAIIWTLTIVVSFILLREYCRRVCFARLWFKTPLVVDCGVAVLQLSGLLLMARYGLLSAIRAFWVIGIACGVSASCWLIIRRRDFAPVFKFAMTDFGKNWSFGKWMIGGRAFLLMSIQIYPWLLAGFHGVSATGIFAACWGIASLVTPFVSGMNNFLGPVTAHAIGSGVSELRLVVFKTTVMLTGAMGLFCLAIFFFGDQFVVLMYGTNYTGNGSVVSTLALSTLFGAIVSPVAYGLLAIERPDVNFKANLIAIVVALTIGLLLVKSFGPLGVALGLLVCNIVTSTVRFLFFIRIAGGVSRQGVANG